MPHRRSRQRCSLEIAAETSACTAGSRCSIRARAMSFGRRTARAPAPMSSLGRPFHPFYPQKVEKLWALPGDPGPMECAVLRLSACAHGLDHGGAERRFRAWLYPRLGAATIGQARRRVRAAHYVHGAVRARDRREHDRDDRHDRERASSRHVHRTGCPLFDCLHGPIWCITCWRRACRSCGETLLPRRA